jgi:hypothetical protein
MILQAVVNNRIRQAGTGIEVVTTVFTLGPLKLVIIANLPDNGDSGTSYVKLELVPSSEDRDATPKWSIWAPAGRHNTPTRNENES